MIRRFSDSLWRGPSPGSGRAKAWSLVAALAIGLAAIAATDSWRTAAAAAIAAAVLLATRIRFAPVAALVLVALVATVAVGGAAPGHDRRSPSHSHRTSALAR